MKWFKRWLARVVVEGNQVEQDVPMPTTKAGRLVARHDIDSDEGLNIMVRKAMGGKIVTFRTYDHKTDRNNHKIYVIPDDHDFEKELGKLITLESMRM